MPKTTFTATCPDGSTVTRSSATKTYSHAIIARLSYDNALRQARETTNDRTHWDYATKCASVQPGEKYPSPKFSFTVGQDQHDEGQSLLRVYGADGVGAYCAARVAERIDRVEDRKARGEFEKWVALAWASRADLADKAAGTHARIAAYVDVRAVPCSVKGKA